MSILINPVKEQAEQEAQFLLHSDDTRHFSRLYDRFSQALFGFILHWTEDSEVSENILQDVFVKAWRNRTTYDPSKGRVFTWLYNIARNTCIDHFRSRTYRKSKAMVLSGDMSPLDGYPETSGLLPDTIGLRAIVNMLRPEDKQMIELMYFKGYSQSEIAELMHIPLGTVKTRVNRAMKELRYFFKKDLKRTMQVISLT
jgi:RNA polymerase sigma-70 factor, ECF subfamily